MDTTGKKVLIISDPHTRFWKVDKIVQKEGADHVFILGDIFDQFDDGPMDNKNAANWILPKLHDDKFTVLWGNHDLSYAYPQCRCSGWEKEKEIAINNTLNKNDWDKFKWFSVVDDILLTHAGINNLLVPSYLENLSEVAAWLTIEGKLANDCLKNFQQYWLYAIGHSRGGSANIGGITWQDKTEHIPSPKFKQIFGHSFCRKPRAWLNADGTTNSLCIDTSLHYYVTITNKVLEIKCIYKD